MSRIKLLLLFFISLQIGVQAQIKAITETGEKVYLYEDSTWKYIETDTIKETVLNVLFLLILRNLANREMLLFYLKVRRYPLEFI